MIEFLPEDSSQLIQVGVVAGREEGLQIIQKLKKGKILLGILLNVKLG